MPCANRRQTAPQQNRNAMRKPRANRPATEPQCHAQTEGKTPQQNRNAMRKPKANRRNRTAMPRTLIPRAPIPHSELPAVPPRAQTPVPGLNPARLKRRAGPQFTTLRNRPASRRASAEQRFRAKPAPHYRRPARLQAMVGRVVWCYAAASGTASARNSAAARERLPDSAFRIPHSAFPRRFPAHEKGAAFSATPLGEL